MLADPTAVMVDVSLVVPDVPAVIPAPVIPTYALAVLLALPKFTDVCDIITISKLAVATIDFANTGVIVPITPDPPVTASNEYT